MEKEIFTSELEKIATRYGVRIVLAERLGRRWSYVAGAGKELLLPSKMIAEIGRYALFVEGNDFGGEMIVNDVRELLKSQDSKSS